MEFKEELKYLEEKWDGLASMVLNRAGGGVRCKTMSYHCYLKCIDELSKIIKEHPEVLETSVTGCYTQEIK